MTAKRIVRQEFNMKIARFEGSDD